MVRYRNIVLGVNSFRGRWVFLALFVLSILGSAELVFTQSSLIAAGPEGDILTKSVDKAEASSGETLIYTLSLDYAEDNLLQNVLITDEVPDGTSYVSGSATAGGVETNGVVTWELGTNTAGIAGKANGPESLEISTVITVSPPVAASGDLMTVMMTLTANKTLADVVPQMLAISGRDGVNAILVSGPAPASATVGPVGTTFTWTYRAWSSGVADPLAGMSAIDGPQSQPVPSQVVSVGPDHVYKNTDFAYTIPSKGLVVLGDSVWYDANGDSIKQDWEPGIPGVMVEARDGGGTSFAGVTDATGRYLIEVPPGFYTLVVADPPVDLTPSTSTLVDTNLLLADEYFLDADFGFTDSTYTMLGNIGNLVFEDTDRNGVFDPGESPLAGVSVNLIRDGNGDGLWDPGEPIIRAQPTQKLAGRRQWQLSVHRTG